MGRIVAICISEKKGRVKKKIPRAKLRENHGIVGDAHAGDWHRQVSILPAESIQVMREKIPNLADGAFAENLVTRDLDFANLTVGSRFCLGQGIVLEVTQIGKECHTACAIQSITGDCIMPNEGIFCRVLKGGELHPGDPVELTSPEQVAPAT